MNILVTGVGGQGTILASKLIAQGAMVAGFKAQTSETIGMAQRGGSVVSHVRIGQENMGVMIPKGEADLILGFEPGEAVRYLPYLRKNGWCIANINAILPVTASLGGAHYSGEEACQYLSQQVSQCLMIDGKDLCRRAASNKVLNVILLAIAVEKGLLPFNQKQLLTIMQEHIKPQFLAINQKAVAVAIQFLNQ